MVYMTLSLKRYFSNWDLSASRIGPLQSILSSRVRGLSALRALNRPANKPCAVYVETELYRLIIIAQTTVARRGRA